MAREFRFGVEDEERWSSARDSNLLDELSANGVSPKPGLELAGVKDRREGIVNLLGLELLDPSREGIENSLEPDPLEPKLDCDGRSVEESDPAKLDSEGRSVEESDPAKLDSEGRSVEESDPAKLDSEGRSGILKLFKGIGLSLLDRNKEGLAAPELGRITLLDLEKSF